MNINDLPKRYQEQARAKLQGRPAVPTTKPESGAGNASAGADAAKEGHPRVDIHVHCRRRRLLDSDNTVAKWVIDAIVAAGVLPTDSPEKVRFTRHSQEVAENEETIITIIEAESCPEHE